MTRLVPLVLSLASVVAVLALACASPGKPRTGPVARILIGNADTFPVHSRQPVQLPVRTLDLAGREVGGPRVGFVWLSGDSIPVSSAGAVICLKNGDATVGASLGSLFARVVVRCRPVRSVRMAGPLDLVRSDSAHLLQAEVVGLDAEPIGGVQARTEVLDRSIARVEGGRVIPVAAGGTLLSLTVGDETATIAVHVYDEVATLDGLRPEQDHVAMPLRLTSGEFRRWHLPAGHWLLVMHAREDEAKGLRLHIEGAYCESLQWPVGRFSCYTREGWSVLVRNSSPLAAPQTGTLLLRRTRA